MTATVLSAAPRRVPLRVVRLSSDLLLAGRLSTLGLRLGAVVEVLTATGSGPLLVRIDGTRLALDPALAHDVTVMAPSVGGA